MPTSYYFISQKRQAAAELHNCYGIGPSELPFETIRNHHRRLHPVRDRAHRRAPQGDREGVRG